MHSNFTVAGAVHNLESVIKDAAERERLLNDGRVLIINVWRPLKTVKRDPLAASDWNTLDWWQDRMLTPLILPDGGWS
ncbi:hypothetical protein Asppvi_005362 [Aspergillus pseudoviridinutans]|uniref:Uncharacterized protein n=1 Tax=Aspergillus pseudoviridinutans TaxID=1517512 RepID=A0A9P3BC61_9EURO|nr:uncharacterized protein Asppvi_005362 [Aspergillus pseudoviridinutans]GIJ86473.1 hypothetical protein Asppvi_005362 [Aspergillus pseudoviridinutans]